MADVFVSYKSERRGAARHLEQILTRYGYSVWFDNALVRGHDYEQQIQREITSASAVIVLWCRMSVASEPVRSEASYAKREGKLVGFASQVKRICQDFCHGIESFVSMVRRGGKLQFIDLEFHPFHFPT